MRSQKIRPLSFHTRHGPHVVVHNVARTEHQQLHTPVAENVCDLPVFVKNRFVDQLKWTKKKLDL